MKPAAFEYVRPTSLQDGLQQLSAGDDVKVLAGGQSLVPLMNFRLARPARLVDVNGLAELDYLVVEGGRLRIGALCRHARLEREARRLPPEWAGLAEAARLIGHYP